MIYWMTGQPGAGKTTLAKMLIDFIGEFNDPCSRKVYHIDGDNLRALTLNQDYSRDGRIRNIEGAQKIAHYLHNEGCDVIVSVVSPYRWQRDEFKKALKGSLIEIYVHTSGERERDHFKVDDYEAPVENFIDIDTTEDSPEESLRKIFTQLHVQINKELNVQA